VSCPDICLAVSRRMGSLGSQLGGFLPGLRHLQEYVALCIGAGRPSPTEALQRVLAILLNIHDMASSCRRRPCAQDAVRLIAGSRKNCVISSRLFEVGPRVLAQDGAEAAGDHGHKATRAVIIRATVTVAERPER
jgi:hypothetical protein